MTLTRVLVVSAPRLLLGLLLGCGAEDDPPPTEPLGPLVEPHCTSPSELCLPSPTAGFQIRSEGAEIGPGEDVEYCEVVALPGTPDQTFHVRAFETQMTHGSHHLIVAAVDPDTQTDANTDVGMRRECTGPDVFGGELSPVTGSQRPYHQEIFPAGVGRVYRGGEKVVFDYHYFNTGTAPIRARAAVNFHTTSPGEITRVSRSFGFVNLGIEVPPGAEASFTNECTFSTDLYVHKLVRHTHRWGTEFKAWYQGGERDGQLAFTSPNYETVDFPFEEPVLMRAGQGFRFECSFLNTESHTLTFGVNATDEMCILFGDWYAAEGRSEDAPSQGCLVF